MIMVLGGGWLVAGVQLSRLSLLYVSSILLVDEIMDYSIFKFVGLQLGKFIAHFYFPILAILLKPNLRILFYFVI